MPGVCLAEASLDLAAFGGEDDSAGAGVVGIRPAVDEATLLQAGPEPGDPRLGEQGAAEQARDPQAVLRPGQRVEHAVLARREAIPVPLVPDLACEGRLGPEHRLPGLVGQSADAGHHNAGGKPATRAGSLSWYGEVPERLSPRSGFGRGW